MRKPIFSIIIPTYNRLNDLWRCLHLFTAVNYPKDNFEIIIVDDGNERADRTIMHYQDKLNITLIKSGGVGPAKARNKGAETAKGIFLAFTDDDCTADRQWLKNLEKHLTEKPNCLIGGHTLNGIDNIYSTASQMLIDYLYNYYNEIAEYSKFITSNNFAISANKFKQIGGFNEQFPLAAAEDREFCQRWIKHGYNIVYEKNAIIHHWHELNFYTFCQQQFNYGRGAYSFQNLQKPGRKIQPRFFYIELLLYPLKIGGYKNMGIATLFLVSQIAVATGLIYQKFTSSRHPSPEQQPTT
ncbi:glycosyltransferase [Microcoleus sp. B4-C1]|uniref:glycosyltransferase n=1 Tax=Microcoleus sp. B4-C1 TaxID=2818660 RepID=UPI002FCF8125